MGPSLFQYYFFLFLAVALALALAGISIFSIIKPKSIRHKEISLYLFTVLGYLLVNSLELLSTSEELTLLFAKSCYLFFGFLPTWWLVFTLAYVGEKRAVKYFRYVLVILPLVSVALALSNEQHHLIWKEWTFKLVGPFTTMKPLAYGPAFWSILAYGQLVAIAGTVIILRDQFRKSLAFSSQSLIIFIAVLIPFITNLLYITRAIPGFVKDYSPLAYSLSGILVTIGVYYDRLFDLPPIARRVLIEATNDPLIVIDDRRRIVVVNRSGRGLDPSSGIEIGASIDSIPLLSRLDSLLRGDETRPAEISSGELWYEASVSLIPAPGRTLKLYSLRDITLRRRLLEEKTALVAELTEALSRIKTLEGIIPICASCKKVRDDKGFWQQVEGYLASRTSVEFSHGLCPECKERLYPDLSEEENREKRRRRL